MATYLILAQSDATANALEAWLELLGEKRCFDKTKQCIVWEEQSVGSGEKGVLAYQSLVRRIEDAAANPSGAIPLNEVIILVDSVRMTELNPLAEGGWNSLIAMLILTFPEIRWVFGIGSNHNELEEYHSLTSLLTKPRRDPLFDATGLRNFAKDQVAESLLSDSEKALPNQEKVDLKKSRVPNRFQKAAAIDEESSYALFHAYTAYRFGYRADAVRSWSLMKELFHSELEFSLKNFTPQFAIVGLFEKLHDLKLIDTYLYSEICADIFEKSKELIKSINHSETLKSEADDHIVKCIKSIDKTTRLQNFVDLIDKFANRKADNDDNKKNLVIAMRYLLDNTLCTRLNSLEPQGNSLQKTASPNLTTKYQTRKFLQDKINNFPPDFELKGHEFNLLFEDVNLNFPDQTEYVHLSQFEEKRSNECSKLGYTFSLENSSFRIIVSTGHSSTSNNTIHDNVEYVRRHKPYGHGIVYKPAGGIFDLWRKAKLFSRLPKEGNKQKGYASNFIWPTDTESDGSSYGHSAPGRLMMIAQHLVRRADSLRNSANTIEECIRGAVLATDALELLRFQTPTLSLQALSLKHEFEVKAEVAFLGVGYHFELDRRFEELIRDVKVASQFFESRRRKAAELDTLVSIGNALMLTFRNAGQFDEEQICMAKIRSWHRDMRMKQSRDVFDKASQFIMLYAEWLLVKPRRFVGAILFWFIVFWGLWFLMGQQEGHLARSASLAWNAFIANNPESPMAGVAIPVLFLNALATGFGLFHLGVFISYLYSAVSRK